MKTLNIIKFVIIGFIVAAAFSSCVVYAHPAHLYHYRKQEIELFTKL
jgi:hypothetical protein